MAGIYDRIGGTDNVAVAVLDAVLTAYTAGDLTRAQALSIVQNHLASRNPPGAPLDATAIADMGKLADSLDLGDTTAKLVKLSQITAYHRGMEIGIAELTETVYRNRLGIT